MDTPLEYGVAATVRLPMLKRGVVDFAVGADWTPATGDVKISIDGGAAANVATLPTAVAMGNTAYWSFPLSAAELTGGKMIVTVADAATKAVEDQAFAIYTHSHPSAFDPRGVKRGRATAGGVAAQTITLAAEAAPGLDFFGGDVVEIISATTGAGQWNMVQTSTNANPPVPTMVRPWPVALTGTVVYRIYGGAGEPATAAEVSAPAIAVLGSPVGTVSSDIADLPASVTAAALTTAMTEAYSADGATMTVAQALHEIKAFLFEKNISGTTVTCKKLDGSTTAMTLTINSATVPTTITRAT